MRTAAETRLLVRLVTPITLIVCAGLFGCAAGGESGNPPDSDGPEGMDSPNPDGPPSGPAPGDEPSPIELGNACEGEADFIAAPLEAPGGHIAIRLTPEITPLLVRTLRYELVDADEVGFCNPTIQHQVSVFTGLLDAPSGSPIADFEAAIAGPSGKADAASGSYVEVELDEPLAVRSGESIFVAINLPLDDADNSLCVRSCSGRTDEGRNFWTDDDSAPYSWSDLTDLRATIGNVQVSVVGVVNP